MKKRHFGFREGSKVNQVTCAILINMPVFMCGSCIGWMSPMTLLLQSKDSPKLIPLTDFEVSCMGAIAYLIYVPAYFGIIALSNMIGRKNTMFFLSATGFGCWAIKLLWMDTWAFIVARALVGVLMAGCYSTCPLYTKEISEDSIKGRLNSLIIIFHTTGNLFLYIIGDILSYRAILWICLAIPAIHLVLIMMMAESPSYLVKTGDMEEAARTLAWLRCRDKDDAAVLNEIIKIKKEQIKCEESNKFEFKAIVSDKLLLRAFKIAMVMALARELCGTIPVMNFAGEIFSDAFEDFELILTANQQAMILGVVQVIGSLSAFSLMEKAGRKWLFFTTSLISGLSMCALASWFVARSYGIHAVGWLPVTTLCLSVFCDSFGLQPISVIIVGEIFSYKYRSTVLAATTSLGSFSAFIQMLVFKPAANAIGFEVAFYCFGAVCLLAAIYALLVLPETKFRGLDDIYEDLKTKKEKNLDKQESSVEKEKEVTV